MALLSVGHTLPLHSSTQCVYHLLTLPHDQAARCSQVCKKWVVVHDNLPPVTLLELVEMNALITGKVSRVSSSGTVCSLLGPGTR